MRPQAVTEALESRRLFAAILGPDVAWAQDGYTTNAGLSNHYLGPVGQNEFMTVSGNVAAAINDAYVFRRYGNDGELRASFSSTGTDTATKFTLDRQDRIVSVGSNDVVVRRYTTAGRPDAGFGDNGVALLNNFVADPHYKSDTAQAFTTDANGAVYIFRTLTYYPDPAKYENYSQTWIVTKLRADGTYDTAFGKDGHAVLARRVESGYVSDAFVDVDADGRVRVAVQGGDGKFITRRLRPDGTADSKYGTNGAATSDIYTYGEHSVTPDRTGGLLVATLFNNKSGFRGGALVRLDARGRIDRSFGANGLAATTFEAGRGSVVSYPDGTIAVKYDDVVTRLDSGGRPIRNAAPREIRGVLDLVGVMPDGALIGDGEDYDGHVSRVVSLRPAALGSSGTLYLHGTVGDDSYRLRQGPADGVMTVDYNGNRFGQFADVTAVTATLAEGNNTLLDRYYAGTLDLPISVTSGGGNDYIYTGAGADYVSAGAGDDVVISGAGNDRVQNNNSGRDVYDLGDGNDYLVHDSGPTTIAGGSGRDKIYADNDAAGNRIDGGDGNDVIGAGNGRNTVYGGAGDDVIVSSSGIDYVIGGAGNDTLQTGAGDDVLYAGNFTGTVAVSRNVLDGGTGRDRAARESPGDDLTGIESLLS